MQKRTRQRTMYGRVRIALRNKSYVRSGETSVIGAGSVVPRSIPANCVAVGNPCRPIRFFSEQELRQGQDAADELSGTAASSVRGGR